MAESNLLDSYLSKKINGYKAGSHSAETVAFAAALDCVSKVAPDLSRAILRELAPDTQGRNIAWEIAPLPEVLADRALLKQVWVNLLSNAVKYTRRRERAEIRIGWTDRPGEFEFCVRDNSKGWALIMRAIKRLKGIW